MNDYGPGVRACWEPPVTARPVVEELAEVRAREREILRTLCATCGHTYSLHAHATPGVCTHRLFRSGERPYDCRCRAFVDPVEVLTP